MDVFGDCIQILIRLIVHDNRQMASQRKARIQA
jgi:hypothetical protein